MALAYLGGGNLSYVSGGTRYFSSDYGKTWPSSIVDQQYNSPSSGLQTLSMENRVAVDRDANGNATRLMEIGYYPVTGKTYPQQDGYHTVFRYSLDGGHTWQGNLEPPTWTFPVTYNGQVYESAANEGCVVRAANGWLVAALRTNMPPRFFPDEDYTTTSMGRASRSRRTTAQRGPRLPPSTRPAGTMPILIFCPTAIWS